MRAHVEILQQTATTIPAPVDALGEIRCLLEENGRRRLGALGGQGENVDGDFLPCELITAGQWQLTAFWAAKTQFIRPT